MNIAPIVLFCYKRTDTLIRCVTSLQKCIESKETDLIIISDWAATDLDVEKVISVRQYLSTISGFKSIEIIERVTNLGIDYGIRDGIRLMSERFSKFIIVEDDVVVASNFLNFLNTSLNVYENNTDILTVTAFSYVNKIPKNYPYDIYFAKRTCPWGWATWSDKINKVDWEIKDKEDFLQSKILKKEFNKWGSDRSRMLIKTLQGKVKTWDIRLDYHQFKYDSCSIYPINNLVENIGFGSNDGSNTFGYNRFKTELKQDSNVKYNLPNSIVYDKYISKKFIEKNSVAQRIFTRLMKLINIQN